MHKIAYIGKRPGLHIPAPRAHAADTAAAGIAPKFRAAKSVNHAAAAPPSETAPSPTGASAQTKAPQKNISCAGDMLFAEEYARYIPEKAAQSANSPAEIKREKIKS